MSALTRKSVRRAAGAVAAVVCSGSLLAAPSLAAADQGLSPEERVAAQWYANDWLKFDQLRDLGATGKGVKIAVIDSGINPDVPELKGANVKVIGSTCLDADGEKPLEIASDDPALAAHGTNAVSMLVGNGVAGDGGVGARGIAPEAEVWFYGVGPLVKDMTFCVKNDPAMAKGKQDLIEDLENANPPSDNRDGHMELVPKVFFQAGDPTALAARIAIRDGADIITSSISTSSSYEWAQVMIEAKKAGVLVLAATKNPAAPFSGGIDDYDYMTNGIVAVSAIGPDHGLLADPVDGWEVEGSSNLAVLGPGENMLGVGTEETGWGPSIINGTSYATPVVAGSLALGVQKFPDATPDQILQALVRTTGDGTVHEPVWSDRQHGYGELNTLGLLNSNPTEFPDKNPLYVYSLDDPRCLYSDGSGGGDLNDAGRWKCEWATDPTPEQEDAYWAERASTDTAASKPSAAADQGDALSNTFTLALWVGAGLLLLGVVATAVIVPVSVSRSRKRKDAQQAGPQQPTGYPMPPQQHQQYPTPTDHVSHHGGSL